MKITIRSQLYSTSSGFVLKVVSLLCLSQLFCTPKQATTDSPADSAELVLFEEDFEDAHWASRGWYDNSQIELSAEKKVQGNGSCVWHWKKQGDILPGGKGGRVRIPPTESVTLSFYIRHSDNWEWTGRGYHPHEFLFMTTEDGEHTGPASTHLTLYVEAIDGKPTLGIQDSKNIDESRIGEKLVGITERRAVAGGNGDSDGYSGSYYKFGELYRNGKHWQPEEIYFSDEPGPRYKGSWHHVKAHFKLNSIVDGKGINDGVLQYWQDGELIMDCHDVVFRTGQHPDMKINQFLMLPYIGPGAKREQKIWIDNLKITR